MAEKILFLVHKMTMGFGVSVVVHHLSKELIDSGIDVFVGCLEFDPGEFGYEVFGLNADANEIEELIFEKNITHIVAHTTPFFEILPAIKSPCKKVVYEHGDPTPELFPFDGQERKIIADRKRNTVYPNVDIVVAISEFIRSDIGWPESLVIRNGADHIVSTPKGASSNNRLTIGTLMRLGAGEAYYKGNSLYLDLVSRFSGDERVQFQLMGRGTEEDAKVFREQGVEVFLNASDDERASYLEGIDIFVSMSLWEGFNLPLVESAVGGAMPLALDTGAHPEVTPMIFSSVSEMAGYINWAANEDGNIFQKQRQAVCDEIKNRFRWQETAREFVEKVL